MIRVGVVDDHPVVRDGVKRVLEREGAIRVVAEGSTGADALALCESAIDILLLDISMPGSDFLETLAALQRDYPEVKVLVVTMHSEKQYAARALRAGAAGYVTKNRVSDELAGAIRHIHSGHTYLSPALADELATGLAPGDPEQLHVGLSDREYQVLVALARGSSNKEIAFDLSISGKTVSSYRARVLDKMGLATNADLVRYALEHGLLGDEPSSP